MRSRRFTPSLATAHESRPVPTPLPEQESGWLRGRASRPPSGSTRLFERCTLGVRAGKLLDECDVAFRHLSKDGRELKGHSTLRPLSYAACGRAPMTCAQIRSAPIADRFWFSPSWSPSRKQLGEQGGEQACARGVPPYASSLSNLMTISKTTLQLTRMRQVPASTVVS
jgi:hypothetical protein